MARTPPITPLLRARASTRSFDPRPLVDRTVLALLEAARWAPSWGNLQPWRFVAVRDPGARAAIAAAFTRGNAWAAQAPLLIVVAADPADAKSRDGQSYYLFDCGLAAENLILEAVARGLVAHPFAGWDEAQVRAVLGAPESVRIAIIIAIGYPGAAPPEPPDGRGERPRERKAVRELAFADRWECALPAASEEDEDDADGA